VGAQLGELGVQRGGHAVKAGVQQRLELPQLRGEAVAGMHARHAGSVGAADSGTEGGVLATRLTVRVQVGRVYSDFANAMPTIVRIG